MDKDIFTRMGAKVVMKARYEDDGIDWICCDYVDWEGQRDFTLLDLSGSALFDLFAELPVVGRGIVEGSLEVTEGSNAFYLYGTREGAGVECLGCLGTDYGEGDPNESAEELADAYRFELVEGVL